MKKCLFLMLMMVSMSVMGQSIKSIEDDPFEGKRVIVTETEKLTKETIKNASGQTMFYVRSLGPTIAIHILWQSRGNYIVSEGQKAIFLLTDGTTVTLNALWDVLPKPGVASTAAVKPAGVLGLEIPYGGKDILKLAESDVKGIRIYTSDGYKDFMIDKKRQPLIKETMQLLISKMDL